MNPLGAIASHVLPLYGVLLFGWAIGKHTGGLARWISGLLVYALIPVLVLGNVQQAEVAQIAIITPLMFAVAAAMSLPAWWLSKRIGEDFDPRLLSASFSFFNVAFFGIPVVKALFGEAEISTVVCAYMGSALYGDTIGYYLIARSKVGGKRAATQALRVPLVYAMVAAIVLRVWEVPLPAVMDTVQPGVSLAVSVLGMGVVGLGLGQAGEGRTEPRLLAKILALRQVSAAVLLALALGIEALALGTLDRQDRIIVGLVALFPIAANITVFATLIDKNKREAAILIGASSAVSLILVAAVVGVAGGMLTG